MTNQNNQTTLDVQKKKAALDPRLGDIGWAVLLITIGTIWLLPEKQVPQGSWLIAAGLILLGLNAVRYFNGIRMSGFSLVLGTLALLAGIGTFFAWNLPLFAIALVVIGVCEAYPPALFEMPQLSHICSAPSRSYLLERCPQLFALTNPLPSLRNLASPNDSSP